LLLLSSEPDREWRAADLCHALYITDAAAETQLERLTAHGILSSAGGGAYRYAPEKSVAEAVAQLAVVYEQWRVRIIEYIYSSPSDSVRSFAHAFRFKGDAET
jgi:hypothetical protein